jgi:hypothetical protein
LATSLSVLLHYSENSFELGKQHLDEEAASLEMAFDLVETNFLTHSHDVEELFIEYERAIAAYRELLGAA